MSLIVGLPCYNEQDNLNELIENILTVIPDVTLFFVDDGSTDNSVSIVEKYASARDSVFLIKHEKNMGLGKAMNTIMCYTAENYSDNDILITFDADNTHTPVIAGAMADMLISENLDVVIASRFAKGGQELGLSMLRKLYSRGARLFCTLVFHIKNVRDYSCGYRAYSVALLKDLQRQFDGVIVDSSGFECMLEIINKCREAKIGEYPLILDYSLKKGASKMRPFKTIIGYFRIALLWGRKRHA